MYQKAPVAVNDNDETDEGVPTTTPVLNNDFDPDDPANQISIYEITEQPTYGTATQVNGAITYDPTQSYDKCKEIAPQFRNFFIDEYQYKIIDTNDELTSNDAIVRIKVNCNRNPPNANNVDKSTDENSALCIDVLDNDSDPVEKDTDGLTITGFTQPATDRGTVEQTEDCDGLKYTPDEEVCGEEPVSGQGFYVAQFSYTIEDSDDAKNDTATVTETTNCC